MNTNPTPQKSPKAIAQKCLDWYKYKPKLRDYIAHAIQQERTAYNALLDKVQLIETERDNLKKEVEYQEILWNRVVKTNHESLNIHALNCSSRWQGPKGTTYFTAPCDCTPVWYA